MKGEEVKRLSAVDTAADLMERLIIIDNRQAWLEENKRNTPDLKPDQVMKFDRASRDCNEARSAIKNRINEVMEEIARGEYESIRESRSFSPPPERFADVLDRHCAEISRYFVSEAFGRGLRAELLGEDDAHAPARAYHRASVRAE